MQRKNNRSVLLLAGMLTTLSLLGATGCKKSNEVGETVPAPPRELIEKSYKGANSQVPPPGPGQASGATSPR